MKRIIMILIVGFCALVLCTCVWAQGGLQEWNNQSLNEIKEHIGVLVDENTRLMQHYQTLHNQYETLNNQFGVKKERLEEITGKPLEPIFINQQKNRYNQLTDDLKSTEYDVLINENKILKLRGELIELGEQQRLRELRLAELQYQHRALEMKLKPEQHELDRDKKNQVEELNALKRELMQSLTKETDILREIEDLKSIGPSYSKKISQLKSEKRQLTYKVSYLENKVNFQYRENEIISDKKELAKKKINLQLRDKVRLEKSLSTKLKALEKDYQQLTNQVNIALGQQNSKRVLMQDLIRVDRKNEELRGKIKDIAEKINQYN